MSVVTPDLVNFGTIEQLLAMSAEALRARLPHHPVNEALYNAAVSGCEDSLELMRERVWQRWEALGLV